MERNLGDQGGEGSTGYGQHIGWYPFIQRQTGGNDLEVVPQPIWEQGPDWTIDQSAGEDCPLWWARLPAKETARDATSGIEPLFVVAGEG